jgi:hypothetical protein
MPAVLHSGALRCGRAPLPMATPRRGGMSPTLRRRLPSASQFHHAPRSAVVMSAAAPEAVARRKVRPHAARARPGDGARQGRPGAGRGQRAPPGVQQLPQDFGFARSCAPGPASRSEAPPLAIAPAPRAPRAPRAPCSSPHPALPPWQAAVLGSLVADAATMGVHWIYQTDKLAALLQSKGRANRPEFFEPPSCPFYQVAPGGGGGWGVGGAVAGGGGLRGSWHAARQLHCAHTCRAGPKPQRQACSPAALPSLTCMRGP